MKTAREVAEPNVILKVVAGSEAIGMVSENSDHDHLGICIEPSEYVLGNGRIPVGNGIIRPFEQWVYRTAEEREGHNPEADQRYKGKTPRSKAGDLDLVVYSLRKFASLAAHGNPSILIALYAKPLSATRQGHRLQENAHFFASRQVGERFLGYLNAQRGRLLGERGQMRVTRTELIEKFGYDTKFASHAVRLGYQGIEFLRDGKLTLPMHEGILGLLSSIRKGGFDLRYVLNLIESMEESIQQQLDGKTDLPEHPNYEAINNLVADMYLRHWGLAPNDQLMSLAMASGRCGLAMSTLRKYHAAGKLTGVIKQRWDFGELEGRPTLHLYYNEVRELRQHLLSRRTS